MRWGEQLEFVAEAGPGDFIYVPPYVPHQEINASPRRAARMRAGALGQRGGGGQSRHRAGREARARSLDRPDPQGLIALPRRRLDPRQAPSKTLTGKPTGPMIVLIDNYDSFTFNLVHYLGELGAEVVVHRNDKITADDVIAADPDAIVLSPGPCTPERGRHLPRPDRARRRRPSRSSASASATRRSARPSAARWCARRCRCTASSREIRHDGAGVFRGINGPFQATRYHSLVVERASLPDDARRSPPRPTTASSWGCAHRACRCTACSSIPRASPPSTAT